MLSKRKLFKYNLYISTTYDGRQRMTLRVNQRHPKLEPRLTVRLPDEVKNLLLLKAKSRKTNASDVCREILTNELTGQFSAEKIAQERFEELQTEHKEILTKLQRLAESVELSHQMSSAIFAYIASRDLTARKGTDAEAVEQTKVAFRIGIGLGAQVSERHKRGVLGKD